jgi:hypothetical protein
MCCIFGDAMLMKFTSSTDIPSSDNESYLVKFCEFMYFMDESCDVLVVESLTTITESLTRDFEKETHKIKKK